MSRFDEIMQIRKIAYVQHVNADISPLGPNFSENTQFHEKSNCTSYIDED